MLPPPFLLFRFLCTSKISGGADSFDRMPESPRWLLLRGKEDDAAAIMARMQDTTPDDEEVQIEIKEINELNAASQDRELSWKEFFSNGKEMNLWRVSAACGSQACQQITVRIIH